jgi:hypothetical protein
MHAAGVEDMYKKEEHPSMTMPVSIEEALRHFGCERTSLPDAVALRAWASEFNNNDSIGIPYSLFSCPLANALNTIPWFQLASGL